MAFAVRIAANPIGKFKSIFKCDRTCISLKQTVYRNAGACIAGAIFYLQECNKGKGWQFWLYGTGDWRFELRANCSQLKSAVTLQRATENNLSPRSKGRLSIAFNSGRFCFPTHCNFAPPANCHRFMRNFFRWSFFRPNIFL